MLNLLHRKKNAEHKSSNRKHPFVQHYLKQAPIFHKLHQGDASKSDKLNTKKFGLTGGIIGALLVIITTIIMKFGFLLEYDSMILGAYHLIGYSLSWWGLVLGGIYGFIDGFILLWLFAWIYNKL